MPKVGGREVKSKEFTNINWESPRMAVIAKRLGNRKRGGAGQSCSFLGLQEHHLLSGRREKMVTTVPGHFISNFPRILHLVGKWSHSCWY